MCLHAVFRLTTMLNLYHFQAHKYPGGANDTHLKENHVGIQTRGKFMLGDSHSYAIVFGSEQFFHIEQLFSREHRCHQTARTTL